MTSDPSSATGGHPSAGRQVPPVVGPALKYVLAVVFVLFALLGANALYLAGITFAEWVTGKTYQNYLFQYMFLGHLVLGLLLVVPFLVFAGAHMRRALRRRNRRAVRMGMGVFVAGLVLVGTGLLLMRLGPLQLKQPTARSAIYWLHVVAPLIVAWLYCLHRLAGPRIRWGLGVTYGGVVGVVSVGLVALHTQDPRQWYQVGPDRGVKYFKPSRARTASGKFIPADALTQSERCKRCHADVHTGWKKSAHRFASFNNPAYLASIRETRKFSMKKDGNVKRSRWCAGCHDPVPFFSGQFDNPNYDLVNGRGAHAGVTCTVCHSITNVNSVKGNADYTIQEPLQYPFAYSDSEALRWVNRQLIKANPAFHKKTFLKDFHTKANFCSTCHKVHLPKALNDYKWLRGQNHYDSYLLSGVSGHGAQSFYYPDKAVTNCNKCHMPLQPSDDFAAERFGDAKKPSIHSHLFPAANTAVPYMVGTEKGLLSPAAGRQAVRKQKAFLEGSLRVDIFGVRKGRSVSAPLVAPVRPEMPTLEPGRQYLFEVVIRTLGMGHHFTQGTTDSNQVWVDAKVTSEGRVIGRSGGMDAAGRVDKWAYFINNFVLDRQGNRIARRNPQDIFTTLYKHQIPPGAARVVHYTMRVPEDVEGPLRLRVKVKYRKFDTRYMRFVRRTAKPGDPAFRGIENGENTLPVTVIAKDAVTFPVKGVNGDVANEPRDIPTWERWNDYGIGLLLKGDSQLRQAASAFKRVEGLGRPKGPLNLARVYYREGRLTAAAGALRRTDRVGSGSTQPWTVAWLSGLVNRERGDLRQATENLEQTLTMQTQAMAKRGFDFSKDYRVINQLGRTLFERAKRAEEGSKTRKKLLRGAVEQFRRTLELDPENRSAHYNLQILYGMLGRAEKSAKHARLHQKYKLNDNARDQAVTKARQKYPAANHAADPPVLYSLQRDGAPGLPGPSVAKTRTSGANDGRAP